jgi:tetratricopeptide (TPR) repeat protein
MKKLLLATAFAAALVAPAKAAPLTTTNCDATGDQGSINAAVAIPSCQEAIRQNPTRSEFVLALGRAYFVAGNFPAAAEQYKRAADMGDMTAQANLGMMYFWGRGVPFQCQTSQRTSLFGCALVVGGTAGTCSVYNAFGTVTRTTYCLKVEWVEQWHQ